MNRFVVDTNVPIVANNRSRSNGPRPTMDCVEAAILFLVALLRDGTACLDADGEIQREYHKHLRSKGEPGVGDRFYLAILNSAPNRVERFQLARRDDGEYADLPQSLIDANFDHADRKFVALASRARATIANATDSDWIIHGVELSACGIDVKFLCDCDKDKWFIPDSRTKVRKSDRATPHPSKSSRARGK